MQNLTSTSYDGVTDYSSIFSPTNHSLFTLSPSDYSDATNTSDVATIVDYDKFLDLSPFQDLIDRRNWCLSQLRSTAKEAEILSDENINLQMINVELNRRLNLMRQAPVVNNFVPTPPSSASPLPSSLSPSVIDNFRRMMIGEKAAAIGRRAWNEESASAVKVVNDPVERTGSGSDDRVKLPKSISVRSTGYLKTVQGSGTSKGQVPVKTAAEAQRVYVRGKKEEEQVEVNVFNQGVTKTELCNKWQQTGACPYGEHCQFAHGVGELRPVLRHPRYKTEVCRMILAGDHCPYGHRCHFRHSLTDEEKLMCKQMKARRSLNL